MAKRKGRIALSIKMKCPKCGAEVFHTLVDEANKTYRCIICGNLISKKK